MRGWNNVIAEPTEYGLARFSLADEWQSHSRPADGVIAGLEPINNPQFNHIKVRHHPSF